MSMSVERTKKKATGDRWLDSADLAAVSVDLVPRRGLEPPRCYSLVPETSASTNSAIWASYLPKQLWFAFQRSLRLYAAFLIGPVAAHHFFCKSGCNHAPVVGKPRLRSARAMCSTQRTGMKKATGDRWLESNDLVKVCLNLVPRRGLEPPRCYSLVPETSASTNSAIWASRLQEAVMF
jgi:hypothetical protein